MRRLASRAFRAAALAALAVGISGATLLAGACGGEKFTASAQAGDGGGLVDGASDAAQSPTFCAQNTGHFFCDDFDRDVGDVKGPWDVIISAGGAAATLDPSQARSAPNALFTSTKPGPQSGSAAGLQKLVGRARDYHATFDIYVDSYGDPSGQIFAFVLSLDFGQNLTLSLGMQSPTSAVVLESSGGANGRVHPLSKGFSSGQWVRVKLDVVLPSGSNPNGSLKVALDGVSVVDDHLNLTSGATLGDAKLGVGLFPGGGTTTSAWGFRFDNVLLDHG